MEHFPIASGEHLNLVLSCCSLVTPDCGLVTPDSPQLPRILGEPATKSQSYYETL